MFSIARFRPTNRVTSLMRAFAVPRPIPHQPTPPRPAATFPHLSLALFVTATTTAIFAEARAPAPADTSPAPARSITWSHVVENLNRYQTERRIRHSVTASHPRPIINRQVWQYTVEFPLSPQADLFSILAKLTAALQSLSGGGGSGTSEIQAEETPTCTVLKISKHECFEIEISVPRLQHLRPDSRVVVDLIKNDPNAKFLPAEMETLTRAYALCQPEDGRVNEIGQLLDGKNSVELGPKETKKSRRHTNPPTVYSYDTDIKMSPEMVAKRARSKLEELGVDVFDGQNSQLSWESLAGYDEVKKRIDDTLTLPLRHPEVYEGIVRGTRKRFESNLPKAVLYEGPPGCGKTLSAKVLASTIGVPFVHVPLETILSKFYGETTRKLAEILQTANDLGRCLVFIDECDSIGLSRSSSTEVHEVTRRTLSVLLRHIDGIDGPQNTILLAATNHKEDIDPALMSRFDVVVSFPLPDLSTRQSILALYAKHLSEADLERIAEVAEGFSGRELLDVCEEAERMHAGRLVREKVEESGSSKSSKCEELPMLSDYVEAVKRKAPHIVGWKKKEARASVFV